jgi:hypothetical protein
VFENCFADDNVDKSFLLFFYFALESTTQSEGSGLGQRIDMYFDQFSEQSSVKKNSCMDGRKNI